MAPQEAEADEEAERAAGETEERKVFHPEPGFVVVKQQRGNLVAEQKGGTHEQGAGEHAEDKAVDAGSEAAVVQVNIEFAVLHLLENLNHPLRQDFDKLLDFHVEPAELFAWRVGERRRSSMPRWNGCITSIRLKRGLSSLAVPSSVTSVLMSMATLVGEHDAIAAHDLDHVGQGRADRKVFEACVA